MFRTYKKLAKLSLNLARESPRRRTPSAFARRASVSSTSSAMAGSRKPRPCWASVNCPERERAKREVWEMRRSGVRCGVCPGCIGCIGCIGCCVWLRHTGSHGVVVIWCLGRLKETIIELIEGKGLIRNKEGKTKSEGLSLSSSSPLLNFLLFLLLFCFVFYRHRLNGSDSFIPRSLIERSIYSHPISTTRSNLWLFTLKHPSQISQ